MKSTPERGFNERFFGHDKASGRYISLWDRVNSYLKLRNRCINAGKSVIVKPRAEIKITDTAKLNLGDYSRISEYAYILMTKPNPVIEIGKYVVVGRNTIISAKELITIGDYTVIAPYCQIQDHDHLINREELITIQSFKTSPIEIGCDVWLSNSVHVLKGVKIGDGAVVGSGSVVTKDVDPYTVVAGVPAEFIKKRE